MSSMRSASSRTTHCRLSSLSASLSISSWMRPGVPTAICGSCASEASCGRSGTPPHSVSTLTFGMKRASARISLLTWSASSRVGHSTRTCSRLCSHCSCASSASAKAAVLPLPVRACASTSRPSSSSGSAPRLDRRHLGVAEGVDGLQQGGREVQVGEFAHAPLSHGNPGPPAGQCCVIVGVPARGPADGARGLATALTIPDTARRMDQRVVFLLSLAAFTSAASLRATDPLLALIAGEFGVTAGTAGAVITGFALAYGVFQLAHGPIGDRFGKFRIITVMTAVSAVATFGCALAPTLGTLTLMRFLAGVTVGAIIPLAMAWIGDTVAYEQRQADHRPLPDRPDAGRGRRVVAVGRARRLVRLAGHFHRARHAVHRHCGAAGARTAAQRAAAPGRRPLGDDRQCAAAHGGPAAAPVGAGDPAGGRDRMRAEHGRVRLRGLGPAAPARRQPRAQRPLDRGLSRGRPAVRDCSPRRWSRVSASTGWRWRAGC